MLHMIQTYAPVTPCVLTTETAVKILVITALVNLLPYTALKQRPFMLRLCYVTL